jgi:hypothetical protein
VGVVEARTYQNVVVEVAVAEAATQNATLLITLSE